MAFGATESLYDIVESGIPTGEGRQRIREAFPDVVARSTLEKNLVLAEFIAEFVDLERLHSGTVQITSTQLKSHSMANNR